MSQEIDQMELHEQTRQLLQGPLKHIRAAALAAALLPLASIAAAPASAQVVCQSAGTVCGFVFRVGVSADHDAINRDAGRPRLRVVLPVSRRTGADRLLH